MPQTPTATESAPILSVRNLKTHFELDEGKVRAVDGVSYDIRSGQVLGIVGESGCGKSVTAYSILRLIQRPGRIVGGQIRLYPEDGTMIPSDRKRPQVAYTPRDRNRSGNAMPPRR